MSIDPQTIWSERFSTIGELIKKNAEPLVERWSGRALKEQSSAERVHHEALRDSLPELLRAIGEALATATAGSAPGHRLAALEHGEQRWQAGWNLTEVVHDYQILRLVILEFLDATLTEPLQTRECMAVGLALDEAISASVVAYVRNREHQLKATHERMTEFLAVLSHELRDPLAPLSTALKVLDADQQSPNSRQALSAAQRSLEHVTQLINDLLDVSRVASGKLTLSKQAVDLAQILDRAFEISAPLIHSQNHSFEVQSPEHQIWLNADPIRLTQVFVNLLNNAAKYTPLGGHIRVQIESEQNNVLIRVSDNGPGISHEILPHIFDFFVQADTAATRAGGGLGIGLALVSRLIDLHGGSIAASCPGLLGGTDFAIRLPRIAAPNQTQQAKVHANTAPVPAKKILLVDDNRDAALMLAIYLRSCGHTVQMGHNAEDAMQLLSAHEPEIVILDIGLPHTDGYTVARKIRATSHAGQVPLIAITGYGQEEDRKRALEAGFNHHLVKPVDLTELSRLIDGI